MLGDGVAFSLMVGLGETYVPAFALAVGLGEVAAGWIMSAPLLAGAVLQLVGPRVVRRLGSQKRWVVLCASGQALCCLGYAVLAALRIVPAWGVFLLAALYWASGMAGGPAWNTWVGTILPPPLRPRFLANRARACQAAVLVGLVVGGVSLQAFSGEPELLDVFAVLFVAAAVARGVSTGFLLRQSEPRPLPASPRSVSALELLRRARSGADGQLLLFMVAMQSAVYVSGPFFTPYMLGELGFSYATFLLLIATSFAAKMLALPLLGSVAKRVGSHRVLYVSTVGILPLSAAWIVSTDLRYLVVLQIVGGVMWAGYELATMLLFFERIEESERTSVLTLFNLANAAAMVGGALVGGLLLGAFGVNAEAYHVLFGLSGIARLGALGLLLRLGRVRATAVPIITRVLGVRPQTGSIDAPLVTGLPSSTRRGVSALHEGGDVDEAAPPARADGTESVKG